MDIKKFLLTSCLTLLLCFIPIEVQGEQITTNVGANQTTYSINPNEFILTNEGYYMLQLTLPDFDRAELTWDSTGNPNFSIRTKEADKEFWSDWNPIAVPNQPFLRNIGGLFQFNPLQNTSNSSVLLELRADSFEEANISSIQLTLSKEPQDTSSTIVMIIIMLAAGGILYIKKRREIAAK